MKCFIVLSALVAVALARPGHLLGYSQHVSHVAPLVYAAPHAHVKLVPGAPIGHDGRVVDTPEVAHAKAEHAAAHAHEKNAVAHEAINSADLLTYAAAPVHVATSYHSDAHVSVPVATSSYHGAHAYHAVAPVAYTKLVPAAPIGHDGRVVDTPEVAHAKAEHAAAHAHEKNAVAHEAINSADLLTYAAAPVHVATSYHSDAHVSVPVATSSYHGAHAYHAVAPVAYTKLVPAAPIGHDGRVVDTPEVAHAKAEHAAAQAHEKNALAHEAINSADLLTYAAAPVHVATSYHSDAHVSVPVATSSYHGAHAYPAVAPVAYTKLVPAAPIGHDGRVVDTPEVAHAKAEHAAAHEEAKASLHAAPQVHLVAAHPVAYAPHYVSAHQW